MSGALYALAALAEIGGCYAFWLWWKQGASALWLVPGGAALGLFAFLLALTPADSAGRSFAVYGGVYLLAALGWMSWVEGESLRLSDLLGGGLALLGAIVIFWGARTTG